MPKNGYLEETDKLVQNTHLTKIKSQRSILLEQYLVLMFRY